MCENEKTTIFYINAFGIHDIYILKVQTVPVANAI